jgi:signal transduction histidine kinase
MKLVEQGLGQNIRNEVTVIHGMAEAIDHGLVDDLADATRQIRDHAAHLVEQANHERRIINLLTEPPDPGPVDMTSAVEQEVDEIRDAYPGAEVETSVTDDVTVNAIPEITDAIWELLENAVQHSDADPPAVRVEVTRDDHDRGVVRIADNGPGIPESERATLLVDHELSQLDHGTGLGLIFVNWIVKLSGGTVAIGENDPRGSVVTLTFQTPAELNSG